MSVRVAFRTDFGQEATGTRQNWWVCTEFNSKTSDGGLLGVALLFAEL